MNGITWLASYPKSGNTWMRVFITNLVRNEERAADINALNTPNFGDRMWWDNAIGWSSSDLTEETLFSMRLDVQNHIARHESVIFKTHDSYLRPHTNFPLFSASATKCAIYILRNPLDVVLSYANHIGQNFPMIIRKMGDMDSTMANNGRGIRPQVTQFLGSWSWHVKTWVDAKDIKLHIVRYEDMHSAPHETFKKVCQVMGLPDDDARVAKAIEHSKFETLKAQEQEKGFRERPRKCDQFFNEGKVDRWKEEMRRPQIKAILREHGEIMERFGYSTEVL